ncbi:MAG: FKBP-type peptidyl-prolyl cis-trans isomerase [Paludibacter sp.]|nr:FKBP-type peptidyl-prolyl cis-trans isomerase [Bacteroidales bacterium]MCM1069672.1 FKBP-type peptidyl-prolyl cis-trans isomerase [Prevotella sp.]MCM1354318.1 FKBP-type peptidyl-prolyl cis-trans isomerase [Bacteroides sp.]MCM1443143.1 FKBP-type peptidyl-prolyl cis-trans isomerase [Muribaculum sp.]MCM1482378.1 FKBP-type peptidyl-prolyl cis-trans isomerase [Paludibacter sp.]
MKKKHLFILLLLTLIVSACKQDNWIDWKLQNQLWLQQKSTESDVQASPSGSGLQYRVDYPGNLSTPQPSRSATVVVDYKGYLINGVMFDSGTGVSFSLPQTNEGFAEGLTLMHEQGDYVFYLPYELAYGDEGNGSEGGSAFIPPYSTLIFEVHLQAIIEN